MTTNKYIYKVNYPVYEENLCKLEMRSLFHREFEEKVFFSNTALRPSVSPFIRNRLDVLHQGSTFEEVLNLIEGNALIANEFMIKYLELEKEGPGFKEKKNYCKKIGLIVEGQPSFTEPKEVFGITQYEGEWFFGTLHEKNAQWAIHNDKPNTYSSSLGLNLAKALINIAGNNDLSKKIIDPCCGVGTVLLEGIAAGYDIVGRELNPKIAEDARANLEHFGYDIQVVTGDIKDIESYYDACIVDLPYGNFSLTSDEEQFHIIANAKRIAKKVVLVSSANLEEEIAKVSLKVVDSCKIGKNRNGTFTRYVWVCA